MPKVIAFGTDKQAYFDLFIESCERHSIEPVIIGWNEKWLGYGKRLIAIRNYIKNLPEKEIIIVVDPFDVIFLSGLDEIEYKFNKLSCAFLCGALKLSKLTGAIYNYEFNISGKKLPPTPTSYDFLNTGTWISRAGFAQYLIDELVDKFRMTETSLDQQLLTYVYINKLYNVDIDWKCEIFHNLLYKDFITRRADLKDLKFTDDRVTNIASGLKPCILHASGNTQMKELGLRLGYDEKMLVPQNLISNLTKKTIFHVGQIIKSHPKIEI